MPPIQVLVCFPSKWNFPGNFSDTWDKIILMISTNWRIYLGLDKPNKCWVIHKKVDYDGEGDDDADDDIDDGELNQCQHDGDDDDGGEINQCPHNGSWFSPQQPPRNISDDWWLMSFMWIFEIERNSFDRYLLENSSIGNISSFSRLLALILHRTFRRPGWIETLSCNQPQLLLKGSILKKIWITS